MPQQSTYEASLTDFVPLEKIGEGSFSSVYKVKRISDGKIYALKKVKIATLKEKERNNALNEIRILASIESQFIIQYKEAFFDKKLELLCIVMEWANEGDLYKKLEASKASKTPLPEKEIWKAILHVCEGLALLHLKSVLHRDIKTANIFISNGIYKLGDLNVSKVQAEQRMAYTQTGTPYYASPEVWRDQPYDSKSDIWSLGCIIYEMCTFRPPFRGKDLQSLYKCVQKGKYEPIPAFYSQELSQVISLCLHRNAKYRMSAEQIIKSNSILSKKCAEYRLERLQSEGNNCVMLQTINFTEDYGQLASNLPKPKYVKRRNKSTETLEKTRSKVTSESSDARSGKKTSVIKRKYDGSSSLQKLKIKENNQEASPKQKRQNELKDICSAYQINELKKVQGSSMPNRPGAKGEPISVRNLPRREYATERRMVTEEREFSGRKERSMLENTTRRYDSVNTKLQKVHSSVICLTKRKGSLLKTNYDKPTQAGANLASIVETRSPKRLLQKNGELGKNCKIKKSEKSQSSHQILNQVHEGVNAAHLHKLKDIERKKEQHEPHSKIEKHSDRAPKLKC